MTDLNARRIAYAKAARMIGAEFARPMTDVEYRAAAAAQRFATIMARRCADELLRIRDA